MINNEEFQDEIGNNHISSSAKNPVRDDAFDISDDENEENSNEESPLATVTTLLQPPLVDQHVKRTQVIQLKPSSLNFLNNPSQSFIDEHEINESIKMLKNVAETKVGLIDSSKNKQLVNLTSQLKKAKLLSENHLNQHNHHHNQMHNLNESRILSESANESVTKRERRDSGVGGSLTREIE